MALRSAKGWSGAGWSRRGAGVTLAGLGLPRRTGATGHSAHRPRPPLPLGRPSWASNCGRSLRGGEGWVTRPSLRSPGAPRARSTPPELPDRLSSPPPGARTHSKSPVGIANSSLHAAPVRARERKKRKTRLPATPPSPRATRPRSPQRLLRTEAKTADAHATGRWSVGGERSVSGFVLLNFHNNNNVYFFSVFVFKIGFRSVVQGRLNG